MQLRMSSQFHILKQNVCRIDHLIDRLGKGGYDRKEFGSANKENNKKENVGIILPCEVRRAS